MKGMAVRAAWRFDKVCRIERPILESVHGVDITNEINIISFDSHFNAPIPLSQISAWPVYAMRS